MKRVWRFSTAALLVLATTPAVSLAQSAGHDRQPTRPPAPPQQSKRQQALLQKQLEAAKQQEALLRGQLKSIKDQLGKKLPPAQRQYLSALQGQLQAQAQLARLQQSQVQQRLQQLAQQQAALAQAAQQQSAAQQAALQQQAAASQEAALQQAAALQLAAQKQAAAEEAYRRQVLHQQQSLYRQLYNEAMPERPATVAERRQKAIAKILGAVFFKVVGEAAKDAEDDLLGALGPVLCDRITASLIESALQDLFPALPPVVRRAAARAARQILDGKLSKWDFTKATIKEELTEALKSDPGLAPGVEVVEFLIELGQAAANRNR